MRYVLFLAILLAAYSAQAASMSDAQMRRAIVNEEIDNYLRERGPCPCPFNTMRNGRACGDWSAYSKPGGEEPICYPERVPPERIREYRRRHGG